MSLFKKSIFHLMDFMYLHIFLTCGVIALTNKEMLSSFQLLSYNIQNGQPIEQRSPKRWQQQHGDTNFIIANTYGRIII